MRKNLGFVPNSILIMQRSEYRRRARFTSGSKTRNLPRYGSIRLAALRQCRTVHAGFCRRGGFGAVTAKMFAELREHWSEEQIVEIVGVIALFDFLNRWKIPWPRRFRMSELRLGKNI
jgi:hypothetical protein